MEEIKKFILLLWRYRLVIIIVPLITVMITFYITKNMPDVFGAPTQIATGIVDETQQMSFADMGMLQESKINQKFVNLVESMRSKSLLNQVAYQLILHDLTSPLPFKEFSPLLKQLDKGAIEHAIVVYREKYKNKQGLNLRDPDESGLNEVMQSMGYDSESINNNLIIFRAGSSDFISIDFISESAELSAFTVNQLCRDFIADYSHLIRESQVASVDFLKKLIQIKADTLAARVNQLAQYKIRNRIINLDQQSTQLLTEIATYKAQEQEVEKTISSLRGTIDNIDKKFNPADRKYTEAATISLNQDIAATRQETQALWDKYLESDFDEKYKRAIDSLSQISTSQISNLNDKYITNPLNTKEALIQNKLTLQVQHDVALYGLASIRKHINDISGNFDKLVPHEAVISSLNRDITIVQNEYEALTAQYNQASMESELPVKLRQVQLAMPGGPQPSKKMLLVILSGIVSGAFCVMVFFVIFFFDNKIKQPSDLALATRAPVLGYLNLVGKSTLDLKGIWKNLHGTPEMLEFKKQLRSTRFEVTRELAASSNSRGQMLSVTSLHEGEGKTLISACISYTYVMISKKVLLIDGNFDNPSITKNSNTQFFIEDYLKTGETEGLDFTSGIMVMGNYGGDKSLLEICDEKLLQSRFDNLKRKFDIILVEIPALESLNKAKEWIMYTDKTVSVFEANQSMTEAKKQHINYLTSINGQFIGWILNKVRAEGKTPEKIDTATVID